MPANKIQNTQSLDFCSYTVVECILTHNSVLIYFGGFENILKLGSVQIGRQVTSD